MQSRRTPNSNQSSRVRIQRWYRGFRYRGNPSELVERISGYIQRNGLARSLPVLRLEKGAKRNKAFYFFIAIESESIGIVPSLVENTNIFQLPFFRTPAVNNCTHFTYEEIKSMVGTAHDVTDYTNPIPYRSQPKTISESPLSLSDISQIPPIDQEKIDQLSQTHEHFLYWLSALGSGTWDSFKKTCEILGLAEPKRILRRLKLLKYITTCNSGSKWEVKPPSLLEIKSDNGDRTFIVHGQRSERFINTLRTFGSLEIYNQPKGEASHCIRFKLPSQISYEAFTQRIQAQGYSVTLTLFENIPDTKNWYSNLPVVQGLLPYNFRIKRFNGKDFIDCTFQNQTGFYQFWTSDSNPQLRSSLFYDQNTESWLQGDWYGLRFLAILSIGQNKEVYYDHEKKTLAIPISQRWPELYESYLVMASGILPTYKDGFLIYDRICLRLAREISDVLGLTLTE